MSDPKPTIRIESCRGDGRCPECGGSVTFTRAVLPCGCRWHQDCSTITAGNGVAFLGHTLDLLTEALRQRDAALGEAAHWKTSDEAWVAVAGRAMAILGNHHSSDLVGVAERAAEERDAAIRELNNVFKARDAAIRERDEARERAQALTAAMAWMKSPMESCMAERADGAGGCGSCALCCKEACERAEKAEATVARQAQRIQQQEVAWSASQARAEKAEALLRGALGQLEVALQDWTGHVPVGWVRQTHTLLSEIREVLK